MAMRATAHLSSLQHFVHEAFCKVVISADDIEAEAALCKFWSPGVQSSETEADTEPTLAGFRAAVEALRARYTNRQLMPEHELKFVLATPEDPSSRTGTVAATHVFSAASSEEEKGDGAAGMVIVIVTTVAVLRVRWVEEEWHRDGGRRELVTEAFVVNVSSEP